MTKSTITRERIQRIIRAINSEAYDEEEIREWLSSDEIMELSRMALAAMDSEPDCKERKLFCSTDTARMRKVISASAGAEATPLYRHAQQPAPEYPEVLPCSVLLEPGLRFGKGIKTSTMLAALARRAVHESDMAALSPEERVEFQARIEDFKALIAQLAPVVPDGYVMVPMRLTAENGAKGALSGEFSETKFVNCPECFGDDECETCDGSGRIEITVPVTWTTIKEIWAKGVEHFAAAPQSPGSEPATVPGKWIPVGERMPEIGDIVLTAMGGVVNVGEMECSAANCRFFTSVISGRELPATHWMPLPAGPQEVKGE